MKIRDALNTYLSESIHQVNGWCQPHLWQVIWPLAQQIGPGPVAEIGVFEGKFLIGLAKTFAASAGHPVWAIDIFEDQARNLDGAGVGKRDVLTRNFEAEGFTPQSLRCISADSLTLGPEHRERIIAQGGMVQFFSVDGCHEVVHTVNDVRFAMSVTAPCGLIAVDDYTNANWPGVQEAIARLYLLETPVFVPLAVTTNKLILCSYAMHRTYLTEIESYLAAHFPTARVKRVTRFGYDSLTVQPDLSTWAPLS